MRVRDSGADAFITSMMKILNCGRAISPEKREEIIVQMASRDGAGLPVLPTASTTRGKYIRSRTAASQGGLEGTNRVRVVPGKIQAVLRRSDDSLKVEPSWRADQRRVEIRYSDDSRTVDLRTDSHWSGVAAESDLSISDFVIWQRQWLSKISTR